MNTENTRRETQSFACIYFIDYAADLILVYGNEFCTIFDVFIVKVFFFCFNIHLLREMDWKRKYNVNAMCFV